MNEKKSKNIIIIALCITLIFMGVGFSILSQDLTVNTTATVQGSWDVHFLPVNSTDSTCTNLEGSNCPDILDKLDNSGSDVNEGLSTGMTLNGNTAATVLLTFNKPGDFVEYTFTVANTGNIDAVLASLSGSEGFVGENAYVQRTITYPATGSALVGTTDTTDHVDTYTTTGLGTLTAPSGTVSFKVRYTLNSKIGSGEGNIPQQYNWNGSATCQAADTGCTQYRTSDTLVFTYEQVR